MMQDIVKILLRYIYINFFYPRDAMLACVYAMAIPSVWVPVCYTRALYQNG